MRRFPDLAATLLLAKGGFFISAVGLGAILSPILLGSCQNVQTEEAPRTDGRSSGTTPSEAKSGQGSTDQGLQGATAKPDLVGVAGTAGAPAPSTPISAATRRTVRGLPDAVRGYASWSTLEDPDGLLPQGTDAACRAYVHLPLGEATVGQRLELPMKRRTIIVIESKRASDDFIRRIDALTRGDLGWELQCFLREQSAESFEEDTADGLPDALACTKLLRSLEEGNVSLILGE